MVINYQKILIGGIKLKFIRNIVRNDEGFTLIEMLVVVAILGILATLAVPRIADITEQSERTVSQSNLKNFHVTMLSYRMSQPNLRFAPDDTAANVLTAWENADINLDEYGVTDVIVSPDGKEYIARNSQFIMETGSFVDGKDWATLSAESPWSDTGAISVSKVKRSL